eukprot:8525910-Karenia_brevis.AAC.1
MASIHTITIWSPKLQTNAQRPIPLSYWFSPPASMVSPSTPAPKNVDVDAATKMAQEIFKKRGKFGCKPPEKMEVEQPKETP